VADEGSAEPQSALEIEIMIATNASQETGSLQQKGVMDGESTESTPAVENEVVLAAERSDENEPRHTEREDDVVGEKNAESPSVLENEVVLAAEPSEEIESLTQKENEPASDTGTSEVPSIPETEVIVLSAATEKELVVGATATEHVEPSNDLDESSSAAMDVSSSAAYDVEKEETAQFKLPTESMPAIPAEVGYVREIVGSTPTAAGNAKSVILVRLSWSRTNPY
jgi:hypothetical protein